MDVDALGVCYLPLEERTKEGCVYAADELSERNCKEPENGNGGKARKDGWDEWNTGCIMGEGVLLIILLVCAYG